MASNLCAAPPLKGNGAAVWNQYSTGEFVIFQAVVGSKVGVFVKCFGRHWLCLVPVGSVDV